MNFSYSAIWEDTVALLRRDASLFVAVAGVFIFLPSLLFAYFVPPTGLEEAQPAEAARILVEYVSANWIYYGFLNLISIGGTLAILLLALDHRKPTVGAAIVAGIGLLPGVFLASIIAAVLIGIGFALFIVPGIYLYGRLAPLWASMVVERQHNPLEGIRRSFVITRGLGWAVVGLVFLVWLAGSVVNIAIVAILGLILLTLAGKSLGTLLLLIVGTALSTMLSVILILLMAAIYRRLAVNTAAA
jgi:hypothetical protein